MAGFFVMAEVPTKVNLPPLVQDNWRRLRQRAIQSAEIHPTIPNYVVFKWINKIENGEDKIDHQAEAQAAEVVYNAFPGIEPDYVLAIGNSGLSFGRAVNKYYPDALFLEAKKLQEPEEHKNGFDYVSAHSYSRDADFEFRLPVIPKGKKVLIIDDVAAHGGVGKPIAEAVQKMGAEIVGYGVYFDKAFQEGLKKIAKGLGILCFSVIRISEINHDHIKLMDEKVSLQLI